MRVPLQRLPRTGASVDPVTTGKRDETGGDEDVHAVHGVVCRECALDESLCFGGVVRDGHAGEPGERGQEPLDVTRRLRVRDRLFVGGAGERPLAPPPVDMPEVRKWIRDQV